MSGAVVQGVVRARVLFRKVRASRAHRRSVTVSDAGGTSSPGLGEEGGGSVAVPVAAGRKRGRGLPAAGVALAVVALAAAAACVAGPSYVALNARHPVAVKAGTSGLVYVVGDLLSQRITGGPDATLDRVRAARSGVAGCVGHGPLSHWWYIALDGFCEAMGLVAWWVVLLKVCLDQLLWSPTWNGCYVAMTGLMKGNRPAQVADDVRRTCIPLLIKSIKLWGPVHIITYWLVPQALRLLWVDAVEILWTIMLSAAANNQNDGGETQTHQ